MWTKQYRFNCIKTTLFTVEIINGELGMVHGRNGSNPNVL